MAEDEVNRRLVLFHPGPRGLWKTSSALTMAFPPTQCPSTNDLDVARIVQITASPVVPLCGCMSYVGAATFGCTVAPAGGHEGRDPAKEETNPSTDDQDPSPRSLN